MVLENAVPASVAALLSFLQNIWPFSPRKLDDLKLSDQIVNCLSIPDHTKQFVFAIPEPESQSVIYILATQNLSERSALDAEFLIKEIRPDVVVVQVPPLALNEMQAEEKNNLGECAEDDTANSVPTSSIGVLKGCFVDKINKEKYESLAGSVVLREIFGVGFYGHFWAAKRVAKDVGSSLLLLESPFVSSCGDDAEATSEPDVGKNNFHALGLNLSSLVPQKVGSVVSSSSKCFFLSSDLHSQTVKSLVAALAQSNAKVSFSSNSVSETRLGDCQPRGDYQAPSFAQSVYSLLTDLHDIFADLPSIGRALAHAQKMLYNVEKGEIVDTQLLTEIHSFRIAVEGLRIGLNNAGRCPINKMENSTSTKSRFSELPIEDKSHALVAQALRNQTKKFRSIVAIMDASSLAGLRKHWNTPIPPEVNDLIEQFFTEYEGEGEMLASEIVDRKRSLATKPVVAVGAGATAVLGASSLSKVLPVSTFMKVVSYKVPASLKLGFTQTQKALAIAFGKTLGPSKVAVSSGAKTTSAMKAIASAEKIRVVAHSVIASAERTSFSAMRTAFYEIMRKRQVQPIGSKPWVTLGCSVATCTGLFFYGDGIECAAESIPVAPAIASLGRGLQSLHQASQVVRLADGTKMQEAMQSLMYSLKKVKAQ